MFKIILVGYLYGIKSERRLEEGSWVDAEAESKQSMQGYLDCMDEERSQKPRFKRPPVKVVKKRRTTSRTNPDSGYINHGSKRGIGYLIGSTVDRKHSIVTGVDVHSANEKESIQVLRQLERQINLGISMTCYGTDAVHRGLALMGITEYILAIQFANSPEKYGFSYDLTRDSFICQQGALLAYHRLNCNNPLENIGIATQ